MSKKSNVIFKNITKDKMILKYRIDSDINNNKEYLTINGLNTLYMQLVNEIDNSGLNNVNPLKISHNHKIKKMASELKDNKIDINFFIKFLYEVASVNLSSGYTCPAAWLCKAYAKSDKNSLNKTGTTLIKNSLTGSGNDKIGYCYSASEENQYKDTWLARMHNTKIILSLKDDIITQALTLIKTIQVNRMKIVRIHSAGGMANTSYFIAWLLASMYLKDVLFYGYSKVIQYIRDYMHLWSENFHLTYSHGSIYDDELIYDENDIPTIPTAFVRINKGDYNHLPTACNELEDDIYYIINHIPFVLNLH